MRWHPGSGAGVQNAQKHWIIDVLAQYVISCDGNENGEPDVSVEPALLPPPDIENLRSAVRSLDVTELHHHLAERYSSRAVWLGKGEASDAQFGGLFLQRLQSIRKKQEAALRARRDLNLLQEQYGAPDEDDAWYTTRDPNTLPVGAGQIVVVYGDRDPETNAYPQAYIAFIKAADGHGHEFCRQQREPNTPGIGDTEFLISSDVSCRCPPFSSMFVSPPPLPPLSLLASHIFIISVVPHHRRKIASGMP